MTEIDPRAKPQQIRAYWEGLGFTHKRAVNSFVENRIDSIEVLARMTDGELLRSYGVGRGTLEAIHTFMNGRVRHVRWELRDVDTNELLAEVRRRIDQALPL